MLTFSLVKTDEDQFITVFVAGRDPLPASSTHPNFEAIVSACVTSMQGGDVSADEVCDLFDIAATVTRKFARLSERVTVDADGIKLDGDLVHGTLQEQILDFLDAGEDFGPLVNFYELLMTNPLGDVRQGLYDWIKGQTANGDKLTITQNGNILGYKSVTARAPEWRKDVDTVYVPSRRGEGIVNGVEVSRSQYIEQAPGDVVEMPRSKVLHAPSMACGDGLHIGTYNYAERFSGDTVLLVEFSPRDIVSLPDSNSTWKLRVCRYTVIGPVDEALDVPVYLTKQGDPEPPADCCGNCDEDGEHGCLKPGDRVVDGSGDAATVLGVRYGWVRAKYDDARYSQDGEFRSGWFTKVDEHSTDMTFEAGGDFQVGDRVRDEDGDEGVVVGSEDEDGDIEVEYDDFSFGIEYVGADALVNLTRQHGKGGPTSEAAKGNGRNPAQDEKGKFSAGRPGSTRDASTGRFA